MTEEQRAYAKVWYAKKKQNPEFVLKVRARSLAQRAKFRLDRNRRSNEYYREHKEDPEYIAKRVERNRQYRLLNKEKLKLKKHGEKLKQYKLTVDAYEKILEIQKHLCAICSQPESSVDRATGLIKKLSVDHDHTTGKVRGLLCNACNLGLGKFKDKIVLVENALNYLRKGAV